MIAALRCPHWLFVLTLGCGMAQPEPMRVNHFKGDPRDVDSVRRVMILPFRAASGVLVDAAQIEDAFTNELTKIQRFEVVTQPERAVEHRKIHDNLAHGHLSTEALVALGERYRVDGVLIGTITSSRPYPPMNLGLRIQLVSLHSGQTVWASEGLYDANDARVLEDVEHYAASFAATEASLHGWEINLISPSKFAGYVAHRIVASAR